MTDSDHIVRTIAVPAWMVYLFSGIGVMLAGTVGGVIVQDRGQLHTLGNEVGEQRSEIAAIKVKQQDILDAMNGLRRELRESWTKGQ